MKANKWPRLALALLAFGAILTVIIVCQLLKPAADPRMDALRARGYPITLAELDAWYRRPPNNENAALIYTNAFAQPSFTNTMESPLLDNKWFPPRGQPIAEQDERDMASILATNQETLQLLYSAGAISSARYPIDLKQGHRVLLPHLLNIKRATALLGNQAFVLATKKENENAVKAFGAGGRVADSLSQEPLLISQLVRYASWALLCGRLERAVNATSFSAEQIGRLQTIFLEGEKPDCLERGLAGELATGVSIFNKGTHDLFSPIGEQPDGTQQIAATFGIGVLKASGIFAKDKAFFLDVMSTNLLLARLPYPARFQTSQNRPPPVPPSRFYIVSGMLLPALSRVVVKDAEYTARIRVAQAALAVERYRRENAESLPADLGALVPRYLSEIPNDPFDGQPLRFKKTAKGFIVYSIGSDGKDDGGKEPVPGNRSAPHDVTFIVEK